MRTKLSQARLASPTDASPGGPEPGLLSDHDPQSAGSWVTTPTQTFCSQLANKPVGGQEHVYEPHEHLLRTNTMPGLGLAAGHGDDRGNQGTLPGEFAG